MSRRSSNSSSRLNRITQENDNLDAEIEDLYKDLKSGSNSKDDFESSSDDEPILKTTTRPKIVYHGTANRGRLYADSVDILEKRTHRIENTFEDYECSELLLPKQAIHIPGYKPPSERIYDSTNKKKKFLKEAEIEKNQRFNEEYTFHPQINERSKYMNYDAEHLIQSNQKPEEPVEEKRSERFINEKSQQIAERTKSDFYSRQFRRTTTTPVKEESIKQSSKKKLSLTEQNELVERLTKQKEPTKAPQAMRTPKKAKPSDPQVLEHLVSQSLRKPVAPQEKFDYQPKINPKSKELAKGKSKDLFEESLELHERQRKRAEEVKQWQDMAEIIECSFQPNVRRSRIQTPKKTRIAGMDDFLERMKKTQNEKEKKKQKENEDLQQLKKPYRSGVIIARPVSFEERKREAKDISSSVNEVLAEINQLMNY